MGSRLRRYRLVIITSEKPQCLSTLNEGFIPHSLPPSGSLLLSLLCVSYGHKCKTWDWAWFRPTHRCGCFQFGFASSYSSQLGSQLRTEASEFVSLFFSYFFPFLSLKPVLCPSSSSPFFPQTLKALSSFFL